MLCKYSVTSGTMETDTKIEIKNEIYASQDAGEVFEEEEDEDNEDNFFPETEPPVLVYSSNRNLEMEYSHSPLHGDEDPLQCSIDDLAVTSDTKFSNTSNAFVRKTATSFHSTSKSVLSPIPIINSFNEESELLKDGIQGIVNESVAQIESVVAVKFEEPSKSESDDDGSNKLLQTEPVTADDIPFEVVKKRPKLKIINPAICTKCNIGFPSPDLYEHHMKQSHQEDRPYSCRHCKKPFATNAQRKKHERIHDPTRYTGEPQFACDICGKRYHIKQSMRLHRKIAHFGYKKREKLRKGPVEEHHSTCGVKNPNPYKKPKQIFPCSHCDLTFDKKCFLNGHMISHKRDKPFSCQICQQPFAQQKLVKKHIRTVHENATPTGMSHPRPKWQSGQPCPCEVCGRIFKVPSQLRNHVRLHTGELPHHCVTCGKQFRMKQTLKHHIKRSHNSDILGNPMKLYKCLICGKDDFNVFENLRHHRINNHHHIPYDSEKERPFGCVICGKPYFLREDAIICAQLRHDPTSLLQDMFKFKCPECPPENFGFHNQSVLRTHWKQEHGDKFLPVRLRVGINATNLKENSLPSCRINKHVMQNWKCSGIPAEILTSENPLVIEFPLLPIPEENRFNKKTYKIRRPRLQKPNGEKKRFECEKCGLSVVSRNNLRRHLRVVHNPLRMATMTLVNSYTCCKCGQRFLKKGSLRMHEKVHSQAGLPIRKRGRPRKTTLLSEKEVTFGMRSNSYDDDMVIKQEVVETSDNPTEQDQLFSGINSEGATPFPASSSSLFRCRFCTKRFEKVRALRIHELRAHVLTRSSGVPRKSQPMHFKSTDRTVNVNDVSAVAKMLNCKIVLINLQRCDIQRNNLYNQSTSKGCKGNEKGNCNSVQTKISGEDGNAQAKWASLLGNKVVKILLHRIGMTKSDNGYT